jgi:hypothetical protein
MFMAAWLAGPSQSAVAIRRAVAPYASRPAVAYTALAAFVVLLLWWAPTPATREPALALILVVLLTAGTEVLRRQLVREHPDADMGVAMQRVRERAASVASGARQGASPVVTEATSSPTGGPPNGDDLES